MASDTPGPQDPRCPHGYYKEWCDRCEVDELEAKCKRLQNFIKELIDWKNMTPEDMDKWFERAKIMVDN